MESSSDAAGNALKHNAPRILVCADYFYPAYEAGGAALALTASVRALDERYRQWVVTRNHDIGSKTPFPFLVAAERRTLAVSWRAFGSAKVWYAPSVWSALARLPSLLRRIRPNLVYLNSLFSPLTRGILMWRRIGVGAEVPVFLAPRGELAQAALSIKSTRKRLWIAFARMLGLFNRVSWQASSEKEAVEIQTVLDRWRLDGKVVLIPEIVAVPKTPIHRKRAKAPGSIRLCVLGRVSSIKNIDGILRALRMARGTFTVDVIGPLGDVAYATACKALEEQLPPNVTWRWHGPLSPELALALLGEADVLVAPSHSENFGHAIAEALTRGLPVIVGAETPWSDLVEDGAGWLVASTNERQLRDALENACALSDEAFVLMVDNAHRFAARRVVPADAVTRLDDALCAVISGHDSPWPEDPAY